MLSSGLFAEFPLGVPLELLQYAPQELRRRELCAVLVKLG